MSRRSVGIVAIIIVVAGVAAGGIYYTTRPPPAIACQLVQTPTILYTNPAPSGIQVSNPTFARVNASSATLEYTVNNNANYSIHSEGVSWTGSYHIRSSLPKSNPDVLSTPAAPGSSFRVSVTFSNLTSGQSYVFAPTFSGPTPSSSGLNMVTSETSFGCPF